MSIKVIRPGLLTTIQDIGRHGYQKDGMIVSGAMDKVALRIANLLVGNQENQPVIEITLMGPKIEFQQDALIALTGGDLSPTVNDEVVKMWRPLYVKKGSVLQFGVPILGCRSYLSVSGAFNVPAVMGSTSTSLRARIGGLHGKALQSGDEVLSHPPTETGEAIIKKLVKKQTDRSFQQAFWTIHPKLLPSYETPIIRTMKGAEFDWFTKESQQHFFNQEFDVTPQSDRMGYRLKGKKLVLGQEKELLSSAVTFGTIQVPKEGQPIVLLADHQTTGGYPRIGQVATADFSALAQISPGKKVSFQAISLDEAQHLYMEQEKKINHIKRALRMKI
ncbi:biotin-dependent carboxyltransferase family protein [Priestia megaterium]|uniref:5-oxoprolinase subunit C family protein n=1 Tax=Priestia megaterium TaxID=1404 RepID=UPI0030C9959E